MTPDFTREDQERFFTSLPERRDYRVWGVELDGVGPIGVTGLKNIGSRDAEYWGYIGEQEWWGRGLGHRMLAAVEDRARELGLEELKLRVIESNIPAIRMYEKSGFRRTGAESGTILMEKHLGWKTLA